MVPALDPLRSAGWLVASHALAALGAAVVGAARFNARKGATGRRALGWLWVALMQWTAASSLWTHGFRVVGPFSPIHALSLVVLASAPVAALQGRAGRVARHRRGMIMLHGTALALAGLFTLAPGRVMHAVAFGAA